MTSNRPKVSIGMPVYNAENYIGQAIDSILEQTFSDFELIISDNASTDGTEQICKSYASRDNRVSYYRNEVNLGASKNFNRVFELAKGEYFKWAAHDDTIAPNYLSKCVEVLEANPNTVLCYTKTKIVDEIGGEIYDYEVEMKNAVSEHPHRRFRDLILINHWGIEVFGLFRSGDLGKTSLIESYPGSDRTLMAEVSLLGKFHEIQEYLFFSRDHTDRSIRNGSVHNRAGWFDTSKRGQTVFPQWRLLLELHRCINASTLGVRHKALCYSSLCRWFTVNHNYARLFIDLAMAVEPRSWNWVMKFKNHFRSRTIKNEDLKEKYLSQNSKS